MKALLLAAVLVPDPTLTPGAVTQLTLPQICATHWGHDVRHVTPAMRSEVYAEYGYTKHDKRCPCEIDHLIPRSLGGADVVANLWPQTYRGPWNAHMKDRLEDYAHRAVCDGEKSLDDARSMFLNDWRLAYTQIYGD